MSGGTRRVVQPLPSFSGFASPLLIPRTPDRPYRSHLSPITLLSRHFSSNFLSSSSSPLLKWPVSEWLVGRSKLEQQGIRMLDHTLPCHPQFGKWVSILGHFDFLVKKSHPFCNKIYFFGVTLKPLLVSTKHISFSSRPKTSEQIGREICVRNWFARPPPNLDSTLTQPLASWQTITRSTRTSWEMGMLRHLIVALWHHKLTVVTLWFWSELKKKAKMTYDNVKSLCFS